MNTHNKNHSILYGLPLPGQKITFVAPAVWSYFTSVVQDENTLLVPGHEYTVRHVCLNSSSCYVCLEEFCIEDNPEYCDNQKIFTMKSFKWEKPEIALDDLLGFSVSDLAILNRVYGYGLYIDDAVWHDGSPMLHVSHESYVVTAVKKML